jgi:hypothetical protein
MVFEWINTSKGDGASPWVDEAQIIPSNLVLKMFSVNQMDI